MITTLQLHPVNFKSVSCFLCFPGFLKHRLVSVESINRPSTVRQPSVNRPSTVRQHPSTVFFMGPGLRHFIFLTQHSLLK